MLVAGGSPQYAPIAQTTELRTASIGDLVVAECRAAAGTRLPWHAHEHANLVLLLNGSFTEQFGARTVSCAEPTALYKPAGERHADEYGRAGARFLIVELLPPQLGQLRARGAAVDDVRAVAEPGIVDLSMRLYRELCRPDAYSTLSIAGLVYELLAAVSRGRDATGPGVPHWLHRVLTRLHDEFPRPPSIGDLAADAGVHPDHLSRSFRRQYGVLIGDYVRQLRLEWASRELLSTGLTLAEIAAAAGFADQSEFTRRFREQFGTTPGRYRSALRGPSSRAP